VNCDSSKWPGTWHVIKRAFLKDYLLNIFFIVPYIATRIAQPLIIRETILYIKGPSELPTYAGYLLAIAISICSVLQVIFMHQIFFHGRRIGMRVRNFLSSTIYKHLLTINTASLHNTTAAQTINLVANDASKFEDLGLYFYYFWVVPVEALVMFGIIWSIIGLPTLFGYAILVLYVLMQLVFSKLFGQYRKATMTYTDKRVQAINEIVNGCQIIKMYNWEKAMEQRVREIRRSELSSIFRSSCLRALNIGLSFASLPLISLATFGSSWLMGRPLIAADIFTTMSFFTLIRMPITAYFPYAIEKLSEANISARRIDQFLQLETLVDKREKEQNEKGDHAVILENASFSWKDSPCLSALNGSIKIGTLVGVIGATGAGKSSLLAAILGEMNLTSGKLRQYVNTISYAPQLAWIFADTIRANILLGKPMDEERYKNVIRACCLDIDLRNFGEVGDLMMVGDKGVNLSGGQKARVSLARALYADADLYLLDDPLAAVDPKVAKKIFDQCVGPRSLLREKTRILVTHQTHFLVETNKTILLKNGRIDELHIEQPALGKQSNITAEVDSSDNNETDWTLNTAITDINSIVQDETSTDGAVKWNVWLKLFIAPPLRWFGFFLLIILIFATEALFDATNRWLALWSDKAESNERSSLDAYIYLGLTLGTLIVALVRAFYIFYIILSGATYFHNRMLKGILYTSLRFFESNPSGRILNRASKDQQVLDESLPLAVIDTIQMVLMILGSVVIIGIINPWVLLILVPLAPAFLWIRRFFLRSSCQLKRLESVTRSPIYTLFSSSLDGLTSIRAFNVQADFVNMFMERIDTNSRAYFLLIAAGRWFGLRLDLMASLLTLVTSILAVAVRNTIDPSAAALSMTYCLAIVDLFQWAIRQSAEAETYMTSAERIHEYGQLLRESGKKKHESKVLIQPPNDWPSRGIIEFKNYTFRYRPELEPVLKNLNLRIESKEKIGVIGRTGMVTSIL
jgi:ATP-binding cassette subfamily C (CFTR/MRP) protein 4